MPVFKALGHTSITMNLGTTNTYVPVCTLRYRRRRPVQSTILVSVLGTWCKYTRYQYTSMYATNITSFFGTWYAYVTATVCYSNIRKSSTGTTVYYRYHQVPRTGNIQVPCTLYILTRYRVEPHVLSRGRPRRKAGTALDICIRQKQLCCGAHKKKKCIRIDNRNHIYL